MDMTQWCDASPSAPQGAPMDFSNLRSIARQETRASTTVLEAAERILKTADEHDLARFGAYEIARESARYLRSELETVTRTQARPGREDDTSALAAVRGEQYLPAFGWWVPGIGKTLGDCTYYDLIEAIEYATRREGELKAEAASFERRRRFLERTSKQLTGDKRVRDLGKVAARKLQKAYEEMV